MDINTVISHLTNLKSNGIEEVFASIYTTSDLLSLVRCFGECPSEEVLKGKHMSEFIGILDNAPFDNFLDEIRAKHDKFMSEIKMRPERGDYVECLADPNVVGIVTDIYYDLVNPMVDSIVTILTKDDALRTYRMCELNILERREAFMTLKS